jgi:L-lactate dehydrogenase complex protein LldG
METNTAMTQAIPEALADIDARLSEYRSHVEPLGALVERVPNSLEAAAILRQVATDAEAEAAIFSAEAAAAAPELLAELARLGLRHVIPASVEESRDQRLGVSLAKRAIAETGSVLMAEPTLADRSTAMLTRTSVTLCRTADLAPSLAEAAAVLREVAMQLGGGYATLITGPSRTADIEMSLTVGVQGPARVVIIFVDDLT